MRRTPHSAGHVEQRHRAGDAGGIRVERRIDAARHRGQGRLVENDFDALERPLDSRAG